MLTGRLRAYEGGVTEAQHSQTATKKLLRSSKRKFGALQLPLQQRCNMLTQNLGHLLAVGPSVPVW